MIGEFVRKVIILNSLELTKHKKDIFKDFKNQYRKALAMTCTQLPNADTYVQLHHLTYSNIRKTSTLPADIVQEARNDVWMWRKKFERRNYSGRFKFDSSTIRINEDLFRYVQTKRNNPCFKISYSPYKRLIIPVVKDRQFQRFNSFLNGGWTFNHITLLASGNIAVLLKKEFTKPEPTHRFVVGVDIGSATLAAISVYDNQTGKVIRQLYLGRDIAHRQRLFIKRRAKFSSLADKGSRQAAKSIKRLREKQSDFVKTRSGQIAKQIINLAVEFKAYVAVENLENLRAVRGKSNRKARCKINVIPYYQFTEFLKSNGEMFNIPVVKIDPYHTSKWCPRCGAINSGHCSTNYALYKCKACGLVVNSDRKASLCVGVKSVLERTKSHGLTICGSILISRTQVPVNGLMRPHDVGLKQAIA